MVWDPGVVESTGTLEARGVGQGREGQTGKGCGPVVMHGLRSLGEAFQGVPVSSQVWRHSRCAVRHRKC